MGEHGQFIDGMLDPTERELKKTAKQYAEIFERLVKVYKGLPETNLQ